MSVIEFQEVTKRYGSRIALVRMTLSIGQGGALGLLGPNGAGKTTALRLALGLAHPSSGAVRLQGWDPLDAEGRRGIGYLPERLGLPAHMQVYRYLALHAALSGLSEKKIPGEVERVAEFTGLMDRLEDTLGVLSKGLAQRVGFAQALLGEPQLLLLDEPSTGLDPIGMRQAREWIAAARERGCAVLISSHLLSEVERLCDQLVILNEGKVAAQGAIQDLVRDGEELEDAFVRLIGSKDMSGDIQ